MSRLIGWILNCVYCTLLVALAPAIAYIAVRRGKYRQGWTSKLLGLVPIRRGDRPCIWLHAVSVGEVNLLATTIGEILCRRPDVELVISTTTKTGYDLARRKYGDSHTVFYCPLDFTWAVARAMRRIRPELLVLAELELWPNLISAARRHVARVAIINGRLSDNSFRGYRRVRWFIARVLKQIDVIAAQDETTAKRFLALGAHPDSIITTGSLKYDGAETNRDNPRTRKLRELAGFTDRDVVWLVGSTQAPEEQIAIDIFKRLTPEFPQLRLILVPRHAERFDEVARLLDGSGLNWTRRSRLGTSRQFRPSPNPSPERGGRQESAPQSTAHSSPPTAHCPLPTLLIDSIGELGAWWGTADVGFVGGSFGDRGGQNMIEPAAYGVATCFGPNTRNFRDIVTALLNVDGARVVADEQQLKAFVRQCLTDGSFARDLGNRARAFAAKQLGATERTVDLLFGERSDSERRAA